MKETVVSRRILLKSSVLGLLVASLPNIVHAGNTMPVHDKSDNPFDPPHDRYPAIRLTVASEVVGVSHFNLERLKELVDPRPELAKAIWDWGFGDWESAIGAASHVGRRDIVNYLISKGATPTLFTYAMLGELGAVKAMIESSPGIQKNLGPHGISLLQHARTGIESAGADKTRSQQLVDYLLAFGDADGQTYRITDASVQSGYLGDYKYGEGNEDGFTVKLNMQKMLSLGKLGKSGGTLLPQGGHEFTYKGAPSVTIHFNIEEDRVHSLVLKEPGLTLTAKKIN